MGDFQGILLTLKKRVQSIKENDSQHYKYLVLGYYDGLDINIVDRWYELRPKGLHMRNLQVNLNAPYIDQYTIRTLMPQNREEYQEQGFAYDLWENIGKRDIKKFEKYEKEKRKKYPYITMAVLNLNEMYVKSQTNLAQMERDIITVLRKSIAETGKTVEELNCAVFPSIGYSDFVILFLTDNLKNASDVIGKMRGTVSQNKKVVVSNCYSVCGLDKCYFHSTASCQNTNTQITIRINLKEGISSKDFLGILKKEISERLDKTPDVKELKELQKELKDYYYITFGNSDCLLLPDQPLERYLKLHAPGQILNPDDYFFQNYITNVRTSVRIKETDDQDKGDKVPVLRKNMERYEADFKAFIESYEEFLEKNTMHIRSSKAIQQVMKNYLNIAQTGHGFDVQHVIGIAFQSLINSMNYYMAKEMYSIEDGMSEEEKEERERSNERIWMEKKLAVDALCIFKNCVGGFTADLTRSDRAFIEGNTLTHPSIGSATKLLFAYSAMLETLTRKFNVSSGFTFIVTSGGCDKTEAIDLFSFARVDDEINKLIIIMVPEMSLYDVQGTLFRMLHECIHFIGDRKRKERYAHLITALAEAIAWDITEIEYCDDRFEAFQNHAALYMDGACKAEFSEFLLKEFSESKEEARKAVSQAIQKDKRFSEYSKNEQENAYYASSLRDGILNLKSIVEIFGLNNKKEENLQKQIYMIFYDADRKIVEEICSCLEKKYNDYGLKDKELARRIKLAVQSYRYLQQNYAFRDAHPLERDVKLERYIAKYMELFIGNLPLNQEKKDIISGAEYVYTELFQIILFAMVESFADCGAVHILNMKVEDFLLSFIYEIWNIEEAFAMTVENVFRMGADMAVLYGIEGSLSEKTKAAILQKAERRNEQGYEYKNIQEMLKRMDEILEEYQQEKYNGIRKEIEDYLKEAMHGEWYSEELGNLYTMCDFCSSDKIYEVVNEIINWWKTLGEGN